MNSTENIQEGYRNGLVNSQKLRMNLKTVSNIIQANHVLTGVLLSSMLGPGFNTRSQLRRSLQNAMTINFTG